LAAAEYEWYIGEFMLALNLSKIRAAHEQFEQVYQPGSLERTGDYQVVAPLTLAFDIHKDKQQFRLVGHVQTTLELPCSRCLDGFEWPVDASFDLRYQPRSENTGEGEREIEKTISRRRSMRTIRSTSAS
jgi:uncharacterized metal-binding protein YceD (DUF177 family)